MQAEWLSETEASILQEAHSRVCRAQGHLITALRCWKSGHVREAREVIEQAIENIRIAEQSAEDASIMADAIVVGCYCAEAKKVTE